MGRAISVFGLGYVGSVTATCLAHKGNRVIGVDRNEMKVAAIAAGQTSIVEAQLKELAAKAHAEGFLCATSDTDLAIADSEISFISVGTPSLRNGNLDLSSVQQVCSEIGHALRSKNTFHWIVLRSTVLPGTTESVVIPALEAASGKKNGVSFSVCFNPEFLREGTAVTDFHEPPFTAIGYLPGHNITPVRELYAWAPTEIFETSISSAEMLKYTCNAFHALKVSFANEIGTLCSQLGVDAQKVIEIFQSDTRLNISPAYLSPGFAFGGSCLPKDLKALTYRARQLDLHLPLLNSIMPSNDEHIERAVERVLSTGKRKIGILGLSFKPGTDDLRESPMVRLVKRLMGEGCQIKIWDHNVSLGKLIGSNRQFIEETIPHISSLLCTDQDTVLKDVEVVVLGTKIMNKETLRSHLTSEQLLVDLVNLHCSATTEMFNTVAAR
jgi:GDP-mannose 6-dehydrogenase